MYTNNEYFQWLGLTLLFIILFTLKINPYVVLFIIILSLSLIFYLQTKKLQEHRQEGETPIIQQLKEVIQPLLTKKDFEQLRIFDMKAKFKGKGVAFTLHKRDIYICTMKKDEPNTPEDIEVLTYVLLHELTHQLCKKCFQHDTNFHIEFRKILKEADELGIQYKIQPKVCGQCLL